MQDATADLRISGGVWATYNTFIRLKYTLTVLTESKHLQIYLKQAYKTPFKTAYW